jgi:hypothetical protein
MNGWTNGRDEHLGETIPKAMDNTKTEQLGKNVANYRVCPQLLEK